MECQINFFQYSYVPSIHNIDTFTNALYFAVKYEKNIILSNNFFSLHTVEIVFSMQIVYFQKTNLNKSLKNWNENWVKGMGDECCYVQFILLVYWENISLVSFAIFPPFLFILSLLFIFLGECFTRKLSHCSVLWQFCQFQNSNKIITSHTETYQAIYISAYGIPSEFNTEIFSIDMKLVTIYRFLSDKREYVYLVCTVYLSTDTRKTLWVMGKKCMHTKLTKKKKKKKHHPI